MTESEYRTICEYTSQLDKMREVYNDQQLLDWCQTVMEMCVKDLEGATFEPEPEAPPEETGEEEVVPEPERTTAEKMAILSMQRTVVVTPVSER